MLKNIKLTTIAKYISVILQQTFLVILICDGETEIFNRSSEAINFTFTHTNFQLQKIIFPNIKKMIVQQDILFQSYKDVGILTFQVKLA